MNNQTVYNDNKRNSIFELLRIVSIVLIILWHFATQFGENEKGVLDTGLSFYHLFAIVFGSWGQLGVDVFIIVSAFFLCKHNGFKSRTVVCIVLETMIYGLCLPLFCKYILHEAISTTTIIESVFLLFLGKYWFITAYVLMYIFHPSINYFLHNSSKESLDKLILILSLFVGCYKTFYKSAPISDFLFFVYVYILIFWVEKYHKQVVVKNAKCGFMILSSFLVLIQVALLMIAKCINSQFLISYNYFLNCRCSIVILFDSVFFFYLFAERKPFYNKYINIIASTTLGVYLLHQGFGYNIFYYFLHKDLKNDQLKQCCYMIACTIVIYTICLCIDLIRKAIFDYLLFKPLNKCKCFSKIDNYMNNN